MTCPAALSPSDGALGRQGDLPPDDPNPSKDSDQMTSLDLEDLKRIAEAATFIYLLPADERERVGLAYERTFTPNKVFSILTAYQEAVGKLDALQWVADLYDGEPGAQDVANELADYRMILDNVSKVYCSLTGGRISKANTLSGEVISAAEDVVSELCAEEVREAAEALNDRLQEAVGRVVTAREALKPFAEACEHLHPSHSDGSVTLDGIAVGEWRRAYSVYSALLPPVGGGDEDNGSSGGKEAEDGALPVSPAAHSSAGEG